MAGEGMNLNGRLRQLTLAMRSRKARKRARSSHFTVLSVFKTVSSWLIILDLVTA